MQLPYRIIYGAFCLATTSACCEALLLEDQDGTHRGVELRKAC